MKKILFAVAGTVLLASLAVPAFAGQAAGSTDIDVKAKYTGDFSGINTLVLGAGDSLSLSGSQTLAVTATDARDNGLRMVVTPVWQAGTEAYAWVSARTAQTGREPYSIHMAFYQGNTPAMPQEEVTVRITVPSGYQNASFFYLDGEGQVTQVRTQKEGGNLSFTMQRSGYYGFVKPLAGRQSDSSGDSGNSSASGTMRTDSKKGWIHSERGIVTGTTGSSAMDGYSHWMLDEKGWRLRYADGTYASGTLLAQHRDICWEKVNGFWYVFDTDSYALFGWVYDMDLGAWYYLDVNTGMKIGWYEDVSDGYRYYFDAATGAMATGWRLIDGKWYYFNPAVSGQAWEYDDTLRTWRHRAGSTGRPHGVMYRNETTPDGYSVDETGAWNGRR